MPKCYVFAIGGTGSRVLEHFVYQAAAGCGYNELNKWEIVPVIIDLDEQNGNLDETNKLLESYDKLHNAISKNVSAKPENTFFRYKISKLSQASGFKMKLSTTGKNTLSDIIDYTKLATNDQATTKKFVDLLYSKKDLEMPLNVGFKGHPNIGTIVFGLLPRQATVQGAGNDFASFLSGITTQDRIFIVSSIFGGTGASGFPWLLRTLRHPSNITAERSTILKQVKIGVLSVMPYFQLKANDNSEINSNGFITKTKAALKYYSSNMDTDLDAIYYLADDIGSSASYPNCEGGKDQHNPPHATEYFGSLAIFDFLGKDDAALSSPQKHYKYGVDKPHKDKPELFFSSLDTQSQKIAAPLTLLYLASIMDLKVYPRISAPGALLKINIIEKRGGGIFGRGTIIEDYYGSELYRTLKSFLVKFWDYLVKMDPDQPNSATFTPFVAKGFSIGEKDKMDSGNFTYANVLIRGQDPIGAWRRNVTKPDGNYTTDLGVTISTVKESMEIIGYHNLINFVDECTREAQKLQGDGDDDKTRRYLELLYSGMKRFLTANSHPFVKHF